ncbi:hypothetical protein L6R52_16460 [Myxococcota bacterium]|nr:hypothetical protein [Myxococcota bacterium]
MPTKRAPAWAFALAVALGLAPQTLRAEVTTTSTVARTSTAAQTAAEPDVLELVPDGSSREPAVESIELAPDDDAPIEEAVEVRRARTAVQLEVRLAADVAHDRAKEHVAQLGLGARLEVEVELSNRLTAFVAPKFYWIGAVTEGFDADREALLLEVPEARVTLTLGRFDLRAGALVFNWGSSDLVGPNDVLNPIDYRRALIASIDDSKIPVLAAELVTTVGPVTIRGVVEPFFAPSRFFLTGWDTSVIPPSPSITQTFDLPGLEALLGPDTTDAIGDQLFLVDRPSVRPDNASLALRTTLSLGSADLSATLVHGFEPLPQFELNRDLASLASKIGTALTNRVPIMVDIEALQRVQEAITSGEVLVRGTYARRTQVGFDASWAVDPFVLKLDTSYVFDRTSYTQSFRPITTPWLNTVVGVEYVDGDALQILVEAFAWTMIDLPSNERVQYFEPAAPPPSTTANGKRTIVFPGIAGVARYAVLDGDLAFELIGVVSPTRGDVLAIPMVRYRIDDAQVLVAGATIVGGEVDGYGGAYTHEDDVFVEYRWTH